MSKEAIEQEEHAEEQRAEEQHSEEAPEFTETEQRAIEQGWNPNFKGPNAKSAEEFIEFGEKRTPVLKERNEALLAEVRQLRDQQAQFQQQFFDGMRKAREDERSRTISELEAKRDQAVEDGDTEAYHRINNQIKAEATAPVETPQAPQAAPQAPPEYFEFKANNPWYESDPALTGAADMIGRQILQQNQGINTGDFYKQVEAEMKRQFPAKFGSQAPPAQTERRAPAVRKRKAFGWDNLPEHIRRDAEGQIGAGNIFADKDAYVKAYVKAYGEEA